MIVPPNEWRKGRGDETFQHAAIQCREPRLLLMGDLAVDARLENVAKRRAAFHPVVRDRSDQIAGLSAAEELDGAAVDLGNAHRLHRTSQRLRIVIKVRLKVGDALIAQLLHEREQIVSVHLE